MQSTACLLILIVICHCTEASLCLFPLGETEVSYESLRECGGAAQQDISREGHYPHLGKPTVPLCVQKPNPKPMMWNSLPQQRAQLQILSGAHSKQQMLLLWKHSEEQLSDSSHKHQTLQRMPWDASPNFLHPEAGSYTPGRLKTGLLKTFYNYTPFGLQFHLCTKNTAEHLQKSNTETFSFCPSFWHSP